MVWAVGLRGAVAYGLALNLPQIEGESDEGIPAIESATLVIVMASTLFLGAATGPLLRIFDLQVCRVPPQQASHSPFAFVLCGCVGSLLALHCGPILVIFQTQPLTFL